MMSFVGASAALNLVTFLLLYASARNLRNFSIVDIGWAASFVFTGWLCVVMAQAQGLDPLMILALMYGAWGTRLASHLTVRIVKDLPVEEGRYKKLRAQWAGHVNRNFLIFFLGQALSVLVLAAPLYFVAANPDRQLGTFEIVGLIVWAVAWVGEILADAQLAQFKKDAANKGKVCDVGLWRYSRHPNYFFESVIWIGYFLFACGSPQGWIAVYCPLSMLYLLLFVTGVPPNEAQSLASKGDLYREYQRRTSCFVPWFRKS